MDVVVSGPGEGERFDRGDRVVTIKAAFGEVSAIEIDFDAGWGVDPHRHDDHVDTFYVLEGEVEFTLEDGVVRGAPGTFVAVPRGALHGFRNPGPGRARILNVHAPDAGFADSVRGQ